MQREGVASGKEEQGMPWPKYNCLRRLCLIDVNLLERVNVVLYLPFYYINPDHPFTHLMRMTN